MTLPEYVRWWLRTLTLRGSRSWMAREFGGPRGVRILHADGRVSECALVRDPEDRDGVEQWLAVPPDGTVVGRGDVLEVDYLPACTEITLAAGLDLR